MSQFDKEIFNSLKKIILEQLPVDPNAAAAPAMPTDPNAALAAAPAAPGMPAAPAAPGMPAAPATPAAPEETVSPDQKDIGTVLNNLGLVSIDAFNDWINSNSSGLTPDSKGQLKDSYKRFYEFLRLYNQTKSVIQKTNNNLKSSSGETPIENAKL